MAQCCYGRCLKALNYTQVNSTQIDKNKHTSSPLPIDVGAYASAKSRRKPTNTPPFLQASLPVSEKAPSPFIPNSLN